MLQPESEELPQISHWALAQYWVLSIFLKILEFSCRLQIFFFKSFPGERCARDKLESE
jgi:hypothetical protein